ncbi:MAG TPA: hypothetical protein VLT79_13010 [Gemmatimonadales bacterium]|nr:hypothetical protein [Gemmatimonadales bacterium]
MTHPVRWTVAVALGLAFAACKSVAPVDSPYSTYIKNKQPTTVWVTRANHTVVKVDGPRIFNDTLVGAVQGQYTEIAMSDVAHMSAIKDDKTKTILAATAGGLVTVGALVWIFQGQGSGDGPPPPCDPDTPCGPGTP